MLRTLADAGTSLADFSILKMEAKRSSETFVHTRSTQRHIPEDGIFRSHRCENLESEITFPKYFRAIYTCVKLKPKITVICIGGDILFIGVRDI
jgi:hypothetical protein